VRLGKLPPSIALLCVLAVAGCAHAKGDGTDADAFRPNAFERSRSSLHNQLRAVWWRLASARSRWINQHREVGARAG
jgi:hypothetical protein